MNRGDIYDVPIPGGRHPAVVVTRDWAIPSLRNVTVAGITSTIRGLPTEVLVGSREGLAHESVVNCDSLFTIPKSTMGRLRGALDPEQTRQLGLALKVALGPD